MKRLAAVLLFAALAVPSPAAAQTPLSIPAAKHKLLRADRNYTVSVRGCHRLSAVRVRCTELMLLELKGKSFYTEEWVDIWPHAIRHEYQQEVAEEEAA